MKLYSHVLAIFTMIVVLANVSAQSPVPDDAGLEKVAEGFQFVEGPVWHPDGILLFSDIPANTVYRWDPVMDKTGEFLQPSGNSNGLALDHKGRLVLCQHGKRRVSRLDPNGTETALATHYNGKRLNSPNDLAIKSDRSIYFTDPPYGINDNQEELGFYGIYRITTNLDVVLLDKSLNRPNGICFSPNEKRLYVNDSQARKIYIWDVKDDHTIANKRLFYAMTGDGPADGMKTDTNGNLYSTGPGGVWIFSPDGEVLDKIQVPGQTTNLNWGGPDYQTLYITSGSAVYRISLNATGALIDDAQSLLPFQFELYPNVPNPFNPDTVIRFSTPRVADVSLHIFDATGRWVNTLVDNRVSAGMHTAVWDGTHANGQPVSSGVYYCRMTAGHIHKVRKMLLLR